MDWVDNVALARELAGNGREVTDRTACNRAYYGVLNCGRQWLEGRGVSIDRHRMHQQVWETFKAADGADGTTHRIWALIGILGGALRRLRNQVDYDDEVADLADLAKKAVANAERILELLAELEAANADR